MKRYGRRSKEGKLKSCVQNLLCLRDQDQDLGIIDEKFRLAPSILMHNFLFICPFSRQFLLIEILTRSFEDGNPIEAEFLTNAAQEKCSDLDQNLYLNCLSMP